MDDLSVVRAVCGRCREKMSHVGGPQSASFYENPITNCSQNSNGNQLGGI